jgi:hypothetical protein
MLQACSGFLFDGSVALTVQCEAGEDERRDARRPSWSRAAITKCHRKAIDGFVARRAITLRRH